MRIAVIGSGYVGLVTGGCLASIGHDVICTDSDEAKIRSLEEGKLPIFEPGLDTVVSKPMHEGLQGEVMKSFNHSASSTFSFGRPDLAAEMAVV